LACLLLGVERVDFLRREVRVHRQPLTRPGGGAQSGPPKTPASVRTIPLPQVVIDALAKHLAKHLAEHPAGITAWFSRFLC